MSVGSYAAVIDGDLVEGSHLFGNTLQEGRSSQYELFESDESADDAAAENVREMAAHDPDELVALLGAETICTMWANGTTLEDYIEQNVTADGEFGHGETSVDVTDMLEYVKAEWPELEAWIDEQAESCNYDYSALEDESPYDDDDQEDKDRVIELLKGWQELIDELGFTPTVAYEH
jgi:hypothetical protein